MKWIILVITSVLVTGSVQADVSVQETRTSLVVVNTANESLLGGEGVPVFVLTHSAVARQGNTIYAPRPYL